MSTFISSNRCVKGLIQKSFVEESEPGTRARNEADSNADTCCLGNNFIIMSYTSRTADVYPYDESYTPITNVPIVSGATTYHHPNGNSYILIIHEALYYGKRLSHSLINPNQLRHFGIGFWDNPYDTSHNLSIEIDDEIVIPLQYEGTKLAFESQAPSDHELNTLPHIHLTSKRSWDPHNVVLGKIQRKLRNIDLVRNVSTMMATETYNNVLHENKNFYYDPTSDESILNEINPVLVQLKELYTNVNEPLYSPNAKDLPARRTFVSNERHKRAAVSTLCENWGIGPRKASATLLATTQRGTRSAILPLSRRYKADRYYDTKRLNSKFACDTMWADIKSLNQHKYAQIFTHKCGFAAVYPIDTMSGDSIGYSLQDFINDFGVPEFLTFDGHLSQTSRGSLFMKNIRKHDIKYHISSPRRPNENPAEGGIREVKRRWYRIMTKKRVPRRLWDYGLVWICETGNLTVSSSRYAKGRTALEIITGETPDISEYLDFGFYDWVTYRADAGMGELSLGKWLGVSHKVGQLMSYWILTGTARVISCVTVQRLTNLEQQTIEWKQRMHKYNENIIKRLDHVSNTEMKLDEVPQWNRLSLTEEDEIFMEEFKKIINDESVPEADINEDPPIDDGMYVNMEIGLPRGEDGELEHAIVKKRAVDIEGRPIGVPNKNPILDSSMYEVEYLDGTIEILPANLIAENILSQVDQEGHRQMMLDEIIDHRTNKDAIKKEDGYIINRRHNTKRRKMTTKGWEICTQWKDGSTSWIALKDIKNSYPIEVAKYAIANKIADEPAFAWWVPHTLRKVQTIVSKIKSKYWQRTHKYGIRIPKSAEEAYSIDKENNNTYWTDAIRSEMVKIKGAVQKYNGDPSSLIGYQEVTGHLVFDIKLGEGFRRKARYVGDGHKTETPSSVTYSSVVSRDSVRICLLIAALNDLDIEGADIENAYLTAPCREKVWMRGDKLFGELEGKVLIVKKALYGLRSSSAAFRSFLAETLDNMGFKSSEADPDVWLRPAMKPDGEEYYEYVLCYVDDVLGISINAKELLQEIQRDFKFKKDEIKPPNFYLGGNVERKELNGKKIWTMNSKDYAKLSVENIEKRAIKKGLALPNKAVTPMSSGYRPEIDTSDELGTDDITFFQEIIGILRWMIELGRVDILFEVSLLSSYQASPRLGHLLQALHIVAYIKRKTKLTLYFDPSYPIIDENCFTGNNASVFQDHYRGAKEELPARMPIPRGRLVKTTAFVDASHAADKVTRRSHTGFLIFVNKAPIIWYSKKQNTVESSTFSSEFIAMKTCMEQIVSLRFKLRMFGILVDGPTDVLCDNLSVVNNSSKIESKLDKKHSSIAYHAVRWSVAANILRIGWIDGKENLADAMTKSLPVITRDYLFGNWTY